MNNPWGRTPLENFANWLTRTATWRPVFHLSGRDDHACRKHETALSNSRRRKYLATALFASMVASPGCGIPQLRPALQGPAMPAYYSLNNGVIFGSRDSERDATQASHSETSSEAQTATVALTNLDSQEPVKHEKKITNLFEHFQLTSLTEDAKSDQEVKPEASDKAGTPSSDQEAVEDKVGKSKIVVPPPLLPAAPDTELNDAASSSQIPINIFFNDPYIISLVNQALSGNQELRILAEEININCNEVYARSGEYRPFVTFGAGAGFEKSSRFTRDGAVEEELDVAPNRGFPDPLPDFLVATNVSWELDIWHKLRNAQNAASMRYLGSQEGRNYIVTRLVAEVANSYYELLALDNRLLTLDKTIELQRKSLEVSKAKKDAGRGTELAVQRFQAEVRKNESERLIIQQEIVEAENRINFLVGRYPQPVDRQSVEYLDLHLNTLSSGLPTDLLSNRADIRQAEREVAAAGLDVQVARARFYPSLGLSAGIGLNAYSMKYLLSTPESLLYNAALDLVGPLINKRAIKADYCSANAAQLQSVYNLQRTILMAHIEVVNHLTKVENYRQSIEVKKQQLEALEKSVDSASLLFQNARAEYVEVLLAQRELMEARMLIIDTKRQQLGAIVDSYQALGGGGF